MLVRDMLDHSRFEISNLRKARARGHRLRVSRKNEIVGVSHGGRAAENRNAPGSDILGAFRFRSNYEFKPY